MVTSFIGNLFVQFQQSSILSLTAETTPQIKFHNFQEDIPLRLVSPPVVLLKRLDRQNLWDGKSGPSLQDGYQLSTGAEAPLNPCWFY